MMPIPRKEKRAKIAHGFLTGLVFGIIGGIFLSRYTFTDVAAAMLVLVAGAASVIFLMHIRCPEDMFLDYAIFRYALPSYLLACIIMMLIMFAILR